jgi:citrate synthase
MNRLQTLTLQLYNYDDTPDDTDVYETLRKGLNIIAKLPYLACYAYQAKLHKAYHDSLIIHYPRPEYSIAENILYMLRTDGKFTDQEASVLDALLLIHAEHGGGNNSTFTNVVIGSTGTDLYSAICGSIGSLKGPKHGGANISVNKMMQQIIADTKYSCDETLLRSIVDRILDKDYYDNSGLIYGFGHAVYTLSDPRCELLRSLCKKLAEEQGCLERYAFYEKFESIVKEMVYERRGKPICANVDYYSGFAYTMLGIPEDLFTPLFAIARIAGWVAHNIENKMYDGKIMRPATKYVGDYQEFIPMNERR